MRESFYQRDPNSLMNSQGENVSKMLKQTLKDLDYTYSFFASVLTKTELILLKAAQDYAKTTQQALAKRTNATRVQ